MSPEFSTFLQFFTFGDKDPGSNGAKGTPTAVGHLVYSPSLDHVALAAGEEYGKEDKPWVAGTPTKTVLSHLLPR